MFKMVATVLALTLGTAVQATDLSAMSDAEREAFRAEVRAYLLENPEVIFEAVDILRAREEAAAAAEAEQREELDAQLVVDNAEVLQNDGFSYVGGNPDGDITIVEFLDYRCGYCRKAHSELANLLEKDGNIRWVVKEYPILGQESVNSSRVAVATLQTHGPEAYLAMHNLLMNYSGPITEESVRYLADEIDADADKIIAAYDTPEVQQHIVQVQELGRTMRVSGTPTFVIGDMLVRGYLPPDNFAAAVAHAREQAM